ncbi:hypothetical protein M1563_05020 [Patescibacteria group bacterium]|nr:hypothetical protein [Patescibacteria group bacterium]MCL5409439.1 hypothetical protein [Patescibacteria group bacterium]
MINPDNEHKIEIGSSCEKVISKIWQQNSSIRDLTFVKYRYEPRALPRDKIFKDRHIKVSQPENLTEWLKTTEASLPPGYNLGIFSRVHLENGSIAHLPLMDFDDYYLPISSESPQIIMERLKRVTGEKAGFILQSDRSYHYYGVNLLNGTAAWRKWMYKAILTSIVQGEGQPDKQVAHERYIAHSLLQGGAVLRITTGTRWNVVPTVVAMF